MKKFCVTELLSLLQDWQPKWDEDDLGLAEHIHNETGVVIMDRGSAELALREFVEEHVG